MACYLIEQGKYKHFAGTQIFAARHPKAFAELLDRLVEITIEYLKMQIDAGAEVIQLFDSWAGNLSEADYRRYALPSIVKIFEGLPPEVPTILYASGSKQLAPALVESGAKGIGCDWKASLAELSEIVPAHILLQGNLDPTHLYRPAKEIEEEAKLMLAQGLEHGPFIANLGHGILLDTPVEHAQAFIETAKNYRHPNV
ncbi:UNVERIFIED_CONTAM: hypothetical protein GTU68_041487 [Idotea baltica]|nr:hypothetical protein [Idotea baltica]